MNKEIEFKEIQKFRQWWLILILLTILFTFTYAVISQLIYNIPFGTNPVSNTGLIVLAIIIFMVCAFILMIKLETKINQQGIYVKFYPFHLKFKFINWNEIDRVFIREYSPITEYGGWGLRISLSGNGKAYNVSGNKGLQIVFKNGNKLLIGTNKQEELNLIVNQLNS